MHLAFRKHPTERKNKLCGDNSTMKTSISQNTIYQASIGQKRLVCINNSLIRAFCPKRTLTAQLGASLEGSYNICQWGQRKIGAETDGKTTYLQVS